MVITVFALVLMQYAANAALCYSNGFACQDGGCYHTGGYCMNIGRRNKPVCVCVYDAEKRSIEEAAAGMDAENPQ